MSSAATSIHSRLYEAPGPKTARRIRIVTWLAALALLAVLGLIVRQFYIADQFAARYWSLFGQLTTWTFLGEGLAGTLKVAPVAAAIAFAFALLLLLGRLSKFRLLRWLSIAIIEFTRGVPSLLFIYFFFLVAPQFGLTLSAFWKITLPVAIGVSGIVAEVLRAGINAVPGGQREAALSIGMSERQAFFLVVFPQGFRYVIPTMIAELVIVVKNTTFGYVVNYGDLMSNAKVLVSNYDALLSVYLVTAIIYILINYALNSLAVYLSRRSKYSLTGIVT